MKMNKPTAIALEESITHWKKNANASSVLDVSVSSDECSLCNRFLTEHCDGCPIAEITGIPGCAGTPYDECFSAHRDWEIDIDDKQRADDFKLKANEMIEFLESLRDSRRKDSK